MHNEVIAIVNCCSTTVNIRKTVRLIFIVDEKQITGLQGFDLKKLSLKRRKEGFVRYKITAGNLRLTSVSTLHLK